jgi:hypothetical protein
MKQLKTFEFKAARASRAADHRITLSDLDAARAAFEEVEPRGLFYKAAGELVDLALKRRTSLTVAEALAVLLQTWNKNFYRFHKEFDAGHFAQIEELLRRHEVPLRAYRKQRIEELNDRVRPDVVSLFEEFEAVLGPVGSAKALHLLAPDFFPLWDMVIAAKCGMRLGETGTNGSRYWRFMERARRQCLELRSEGATGSLLKRIDEYKYCRFTRKVTSLIKPV